MDGLDERGGTPDQGGQGGQHAGRAQGQAQGQDGVTAAKEKLGGGIH